jgi:hypothetical protein
MMILPLPRNDLDPTDPSSRSRHKKPSTIDAEIERQLKELTLRSISRDRTTQIRTNSIEDD